MNRKRLLQGIRIVYIVALAVVLARAIVVRREEIARLVAGTRPVMLLAALVLSFVMLGIASLFWTIALSLLGQRTPYADVLFATARSVLARYVPGSIWYAVGRAAILRRGGVAAAPLATTAILEVIMSLATVLGLGAALLGWKGELPGSTGWVIPAVVVLASSISPPVIGVLVRMVPGHRRDQVALSWLGYAKLLATMVCFWLWSAGVFTVYLRSYPASDTFDTALVVGAFLLAWGIGFLALVAPLGAGVFELTLASILVTQGVGEVAIVIGGYRLVTLVRDAVATAVAEVVSSRQRRATAVPS